VDDFQSFLLGVEGDSDIFPGQSWVNVELLREHGDPSALADLSDEGDLPFLDSQRTIRKLEVLAQASDRSFLSDFLSRSVVQGSVGMLGVAAVDKSREFFLDVL